MENRKVLKEEVRDFLRRCLTFVISLVVLAVIHAIATHLPGAGIWVLPRYGITIADLLGAAIGTAAIAVVWRFGQEIGRRLANILPQVPETTALCSSTVFLVVSLIGCASFDQIVLPFLARAGLSWVYYLAFLGLAAFPLYRIARLLLENSDKIAGLILGEKQETVGGEAVTCSHCSTQVRPGKFCTWCGKELAREGGSSGTCPQCGTSLNPGSRFCPGCGVRLGA